MGIDIAKALQQGDDPLMRVWCVQQAAKVSGYEGHSPLSPLNVAQEFYAFITAKEDTPKEVSPPAAKEGFPTYWAGLTAINPSPFRAVNTPQTIRIMAD